MIDQLFALPPEVVLFPVEQLASSVQAQLKTRAGQYGLTNPSGRQTTTLVSAETAGLLELFRQPTSLARAVMEFGERRQVDPHLILDDAYLTIRELISAGFLVVAGSPEQPGRDLPARVADLTVIRLVQRLPDLTVLRARTPAGADVAVKLLRDPQDGAGRALLRREAALLRRAQGCQVPTLVRDGSSDDVPFLAIGWIDGTTVTDHAALRRRPWDTAWRPAVLKLAGALLDAYAELHAEGIVHADVHPKNVLASAAGAVTLIDFGIARAPADPVLRSVRRGGVLPYHEPEWASAQLHRRAPPDATFAGEQYAIGALLYQLFTGHHYVEAVTGTRKMLVRIADAEPVQFREHGIPSWPAVEAVLFRMLAKQPADRFGSVAEATRALRAVEESAPAHQQRTSPARPSTAADLLQTTTERLSRDNGLIDRGLSAAPRVSVNYGAAGIAYYFYRLALASGEPKHLVTALRWLSWAHRQPDDPLAFHSSELGILPSRVGQVSIYHSPAGTACVEALVSNAMGDQRRALHATSAFAAVSRLPCASIDLTVGRASTVLGATLLWEALRGTGVAERCGLLGLGDQTLMSILGQLPGAVGESGLRHRGIAHGWAGVLYAALRWCGATSARVPDVVVSRLDELAALGRTVNGVTSWHGPDDITMAGWCHGPAGYTHLWATAARVLGDDTHAQRALQAARASWPNRERVPTLCCGLAGQAYAMLIAHQISGESSWRTSAHQLTATATREVGTRWCLPNSLWKGDVGVALLVNDLDHPEQSCMPLFGHEGWPPPAQRDQPRVISPCDTGTLTRHQ